MSLYERIGIDLGTRYGRSVIDCVQWAVEHDVHYLDLRIDDRLPEGFDDGEAEEIRSICASGDLHLGLHNESAVNMAEVSPYVREATEQYLFAYLEAAEALDAEWLVVHGGYHFGDYQVRAEAAIDLLERAYARAGEIDLFLENHNPEPSAGEIQYMPVTIGECRQFFDELPVGWAYTVNHAHMRPTGIDGFIDALPIDRCGEVRVADNRGAVEEHLFPGSGTIDFVSMFDRLEGAGFDGHYMLGFETPESMLEGRDYLVELVD